MDARAPMTSRNRRLTTKTTAPRIVLFNKTDLTQIDERQKEILINNEKLLGAEHVLFGSAVDTKSDLIQHSLIDVIKTLAGPERSSRGTIDCIITGLPNVGKSTLFNSFRSIHMYQSTPMLVGNEPGVTKSFNVRPSQSARQFIFY